MPLLIGVLALFFKVFAVYAVTRILLALGLAYWTITGFDALAGDLMDNLQSQMGALPAAMVDIMAIAGVDQAITIIFSCITVRLVMNGLTNGVIGGVAFSGIANAVETE